MWEKWGATYGRNVWVGEKNNKKTDSNARYGEIGVRHMGEMGGWEKTNTLKDPVGLNHSHLK